MYTFDNVVKAILAVLITCVFLMMVMLDPSYKDAIIQLTSVAVGYWLGSSAGSSRKDDIKGSSNATISS